MKYVRQPEYANPNVSLSENIQANCSAMALAFDNCILLKMAMYHHAAWTSICLFIRYSHVAIPFVCLSVVASPF
jgi:hypothetical protein